MYSVDKELLEINQKINRFEYYIKSDGFAKLSNEMKAIVEQKLENLKAYKTLLDLEKNASKQKGI